MSAVLLLFFTRHAETAFLSSLRESMSLCVHQFLIPYQTGWIYSIAMTFTGTSGNLSVALYLASLAEVGQGRTLTRVEVTAIAWGVNILSGIINTIGTKAIGHMSSFNLWWTLGGTFVLVITLLVKAPVKVRTLYLPSQRRS